MEEKPKHYKFLYYAGISATFWAICELVCTDLKSEIKKKIIESVKIDKANNGRPVLISGLIERPESLSDYVFNIQKEGLNLIKKVKRFDGEWKDDLLDAPAFLKNEVQSGKEPAKLEPYKISCYYLNRYPESFKISAKALPPQFKQRLEKQGYVVYVLDNCFYVSKFRRKSGQYKPTTGDYQVTFEYTPSAVYTTVFGEQFNDFIIAYSHPSLYRPTLIMKPGHHSLDTILDSLEIRPNTFLFTTRLLSPLSILLSLYLHLTQS